MTISDGDYKLQITYTATGVSITDQTGAWVQVLPWSGATSTSWHTYAFAVAQGTVSVTIDGVSRGKFWLYASQTAANSQGVTLFAAGASSVLYFEYLYMDALEPIADTFNTLGTRDRAGTGTIEIAPASQLHLRTTSAGGLCRAELVWNLPCHLYSE